MEALGVGQKKVSRSKTIAIFIITIVLGFCLFALPNLFFGITKINGGLTGINLFIIALFQLISVCLLVYFSLAILGKTFRYIGVSGVNWKKDALLGLLGGLAWSVLQFGLFIPNTGGAKRPDVMEVLLMMDGSVTSTLSLLALGVIGGGITEEIFNRGYFINVLKDTFTNSRVGVWLTAGVSILFFAIGHLPTDVVSWFDVLVPTVIYTLLFLIRRRLTAPIVAHSIHNATAIFLTYYLYYSGE